MLGEVAGASRRLLWQRVLSGFGRGEWLHTTFMPKVLSRCGVSSGPHVVDLSCSDDGEWKD